MYCSLATREVASASWRISARCSCTQSRKSRASRAESKTKTGARCMQSAETVQVDAARQVEDLHAPVVGGDQRAFGRRERDQELALGVLAVDPERPGEADRDLRHAGEVLDVALGDGRVEAVPGDVVELHAGELLHELLAPGHHLGAEVRGLIGIPGNRGPRWLCGGDGVVRDDLQPAEGVGLHVAADLVTAVGPAVLPAPSAGPLAERERGRSLRERRRPRPACGRPRDRAGDAGAEPRGRRPAYLVDSRQERVTEPVLEAELEALGVVLEGTRGIELPEQQSRNRHGRYRAGRREWRSQWIPPRP